MSNDFVPGDAVFVLRGPFQGVSGVVRGVDTVNARVLVEVPMGESMKAVTVGFDEVEPA